MFSLGWILLIPIDHLNVGYLDESGFQVIRIWTSQYLVLSLGQQFDKGSVVDDPSDD